MNLAEIVRIEDIDAFAQALGWEPASFGDGFYDRISGVGDPLSLNGYVLSRLHATLSVLVDEQLPGDDLQLVGMLEVPNVHLTQSGSLWVVETEQGRFLFTDTQEEHDKVPRFYTSEEILQRFAEFQQHMQWCESEAHELLT